MVKGLITVIVPVYNVQDYLQRCLDSLCQQSYRNLEVILIDDGSSDNSGEICDQYVEKNAFFHVIHQKNGGLSYARNVAIDIASGEYITFIDSDDYIPHNYIEYLYNLALSYSADISICQPMEFSESDSVMDSEIKGEKLHILKETEALESLLYRKYFFTSAWGKLYKSELWENIRFPIGKLYEDYGTIYKIVAKAKRTVCSNQRLYYYYQRAGSIIHSNNYEDKLCLLRFNDEIEDFVENLYPQLTNAVKSRRFVCDVQVLREIPKKTETKRIILDIKKDILLNRKTVLFDKKAKLTTRILAFSSFFTIEGLIIS